ncbi:CHAT domain-containing protein [Desulfobacterium sp. N47]|uniref:CHAT domain-containing protein n=1 Tax=Desulfobacterium sp. N47 TaxID=3115210 RepID=UPI003C8AA73E
MKLKNYFTISVILLLACFFMACSLSRDIKLSSYAQKQQINEIINAIQPRVDNGDSVSSFQLFMLASSYNGIRNYSKALAITDLLQKQIDNGDRAFVGSDLTVYPRILRGSIYLDQGEPQKAIEEGILAYKLLHEDGREKQSFYTSQLISIYDFLGVAYAISGNKSDAQKIVNSLQNVSITVMNGPEKYSALARIYMALKEYDNALKAIRNPNARVTGAITALYDQTFQEIPNLFILSKSLYETGNIIEAKKGYDRLLGHPQIEQIGGIYWIVLLDRAKIALSEGRKNAAEDMLKKTIDVIEKQRSSINSEAGRIGFVGDKQSAYAELTALLIADDRYAEAFTYVERAKSRALVDLLASQKDIKVRGGQTEQIRITLAELTKAENDLTVVAQSAEDKESQNKTRAVVLKLKKNLHENAPELSALVSVATPSTAEIQEKIKDDETLLEYYCAGSKWYVFILTDKTIVAQKLPVTDLEKNIDALRKNTTAQDLPDFKQYSQMLYRQLFSLAAPAIKTKKLIIVPHGSLHYLPFAALSDGNEYLIDRFSIRMLPSASVLSFLKERAKQEDRGALIFGNPKLDDPKYDLKFAQDEALSISKIIPESNVLLRSDASKTNLEKFGSKYFIIHLAVHGVFDIDKPLNSALLLAADKMNDGLLRAGDLYNLSLNADLVTLSACETALGKVSTGDDVVGLTRGFLYAGARSLISSLWQVDDETTRDIMINFYTNLSKMNKDEALRQAQLKVKKQHPNPYFWAAFLLTGSAM